MSDLSRMRPAELAQAVAARQPLLVPTGTLEYHGGQLPLGTDGLITELFAQALARRTPAVVAPPLPLQPTGYAVSGPGQGTLDIPPELFAAYSREQLAGYAAMGFPRIIVLLHHQSGNMTALLEAARLSATMYTAWRRLGEGWWTRGLRDDGGRVEYCPVTLDTGFFGGHGGQGETEALLALAPELVDLRRCDGDEPFWNRTAAQADPDRAARQLEELLGRWVEKLQA